MLELDEITSSKPAMDPGLCQLQSQIKNVMIPLLIKIFQLRLEVQQSTTPPSRLHSTAPKVCLDDLIQQLQRLDSDIKLLHIWNQSCQTQIEKVLQEAKEGHIASLGNSVKPDYKLHPSVQKSFQGAFLSGEKKPAPLKLVPLSFWKQCLKKTSLLYRTISLWLQT